MKTNINVNFKYAPKHIVPSEEVFSGKVFDLNGTECYVTCRASYDVSVHRAKIDKDMRTLYGMSYDDVYNSWVKRLSRKPLGVWTYIEMKKC